MLLDAKTIGDLIMVSKFYTQESEEFQKALIHYKEHNGL